MTGYRILVPAGIKRFNDEVKALQQRLEGVRFPKNPSGESITIDIILIAEE